MGQFLKGFCMKYQICSCNNLLTIFPVGFAPSGCLWRALEKLVVKGGKVGGKVRERQREQNTSKAAMGRAPGRSASGWERGSRCWREVGQWLSREPLADWLMFTSPLWLFILWPQSGGPHLGCTQESPGELKQYRCPRTFCSGLQVILPIPPSPNRSSGCGPRAPRYHPGIHPFYLFCLIQVSTT